MGLVEVAYVYGWLRWVNQTIIQNPEYVIVADIIASPTLIIKVRVCTKCFTKLISNLAVIEIIKS